MAIQKMKQIFMCWHGTNKRLFSLEKQGTYSVYRLGQTRLGIRICMKVFWKVSKKQFEWLSEVWDWRFRAKGRFDFHWSIVLFE